MDLECEGWNRILEIYKDMDFTKEMEERPELIKYLRGAINQKATGLEDPLKLKEAPVLDDDFSKYILINGIPVCDTKKADKLLALLVKLFAKKKFTITQEDITLNFTEKDGVKETTGQAFVKLDSEEKAKISAAQLNGFQLDKKHTFSVCTFNDFDKIMEYGADAEEKGDDVTQQKTSYLELNAQILETKMTTYAYQTQKNVMVRNLEGQSKIIHTLDEEERPKELAPF